jgi:hypothetical protein
MKSELLQFGDWTVLYMLAVNMEPMVWGELVLELQQILKVLAVPRPHLLTTSPLPKDMIQ